MKAAVLAIGTEIVEGQVINSNGAWIAEQVQDCGVEVLEHRMVPDLEPLMLSALSELTSQYPIVFCIGGLGPTSDDATRGIVSRVYSAPLEWSEPSWRRLAARFHRRGLNPTDNQRQQCWFPRGSHIFPNSAGTADAFTIQNEKSVCAVLPGPPREVRELWPRLRSWIESIVMHQRASASIRSLNFRVIGRGEGELAQWFEKQLSDRGIAVAPPERHELHPREVRVMYRAQRPYVEIKLRFRIEDEGTLGSQIGAIASELGPSLIGGPVFTPKENLKADFLHVDPIPVAEDLKLSAQEIWRLLSPRFTKERVLRLNEVVRRRHLSCVPVLEDIYDRGNTSAVIRTAEGLGCQVFHVIEPGVRFKKANRVTLGAEKWLDLVRWKRTEDCFKDLKSRGYQILVTALKENSVPIEDVDLSRPTAIVFGNEKDGVSPTALEMADAVVAWPMAGFVQSYNISVAAALILSTITRQQSIQGKLRFLTRREQEILRSVFCLRSVDEVEKVLRKLV